LDLIPDASKSNHSSVGADISVIWPISKMEIKFSTGEVGSGMDSLIVFGLSWKNRQVNGITTTDECKLESKGISWKRTDLKMSIS